MTTRFMSGALPSELADLIESLIVERRLMESLRPRSKFGMVASRKPYSGLVKPGIAVQRNRIANLPRVLADNTTTGQPAEDSIQTESYESSPRLFNRKMSFDLLALGATNWTEGINVLLGLQLNQALRSIEGYARKALYQAGAFGHSELTTAVNSATQPVSSLAGLRQVWVADSTTGHGKLVDVSGTNTIAVTLGASTSGTIIAATPTDTDNPDGPGTLTLLAAYNGAIGDRVVAADATPRVYAGAVITPFDMAGTDKMTLAKLDDMKAKLADREVPMFDPVTGEPVDDDGYYILLHPNKTMYDLFDDTSSIAGAFASRPDWLPLKEGKVRIYNGIIFIETSFSPRVSTVDDTTLGLDVHVPVLGGATGLVNLYWPMMIGADCLQLDYQDMQQIDGFDDDSKDLSFNVPGALVTTEDLRWVLKRKGDDDTLRHLVSVWETLRAYTVPTDRLAGDQAGTYTEVFKRICLGCHG